MEEYNGIPNRWDVVLLSHVIYDFPEPLSYHLRRLLDLATPGGRVIIVVTDGQVTPGVNLYDELGME